MARWLAVSVLALAVNSARSADEVVFPGTHWETRDAADLSLDAQRLDQFAEHVGGDGCIVRDGYLVKSWGDVTRHKDWASAAKPVISTLLLLAVQEGRLHSVDAPVRDIGWKLSEKDAPMTFRHLANMVSGYALDEPPGAAWGYNDYAIQLYARSLERLFGSSLDQAFRERLGVLEFEDGEVFGARGNTRVTASSRDFARLGWLWLNRGRWKGQQVLNSQLFDDAFRAQVPAGTPRAVNRTNDYLQIGTYGGGTNQTASGPGVYGFNLWFNAVMEDGRRVWPALPPDAYQANGLWNRDTVTVIPSWRMVVASRGAQPGKFEPSLADGEYNRNLQLLAQAVLRKAS
ncbi:MAG: serine hydrolase domain-containing protein [Pirellulaceae bacterium]